MATTIPNIVAAFQAAVQHQHAGRAAEAARIYRQILATQPDHAGAMQMLGVLAQKGGRGEEAVELLRRAVSLEPDVAEYRSDLGVVLAMRGDHEAALAQFRLAIALRPDFAEGHFNFGNALAAGGNHNEAIGEFQQAIALRPAYAEAHNNLGTVLRENGQLPAAIAAYRRAVAVRPDYVVAWHNLAVVLLDAGQVPEASEAATAAVNRRADFAEAHHTLGNALKRMARLDEAIAAYGRALALRPDLAMAHSNLGSALADSGRLEEAVAAFLRSIELQPDAADAHYNLANALRDRADSEGAIASYRRAIALRPDFPDALNNLANVLKGTGDTDGAIAAYQQALALRPDDPASHANLGRALKDIGRLDESIACLTQAEALGGGAAIASDRLFVLHLHPHVSPEQLLREHLRWDERYARPLAWKIRPHMNARGPNRRLRVGYVSADFSNHPVGRFLLPLLANHDHEQFEIACYSDVRQPDDQTQLLRRHADVWRETSGRSDETLAELIRGDRIDILVDLAMHAGRNRLLAFARKPAPVQVSYLAYGGTTGLHSMDYRLTDPYLDPPGQNDELYAETSVWLPRTYWCYAAPTEAPAVGPLPALAAGRITFGCLNNYAKVNGPTLQLWARLLFAVPASRLILYSPNGNHRDAARQSFAQQGIDPRRIELVARLPMADYLAHYNQIDFALDTHPYGGGTTTCDGLWMAVPVVTLAGRAAASRAGLSILANVGLSELVARTPDEYVRIAVDLAGDLSRLTALRATLRPRMQASPLMDAPRFARDFEAALRGMWQTWARK